MKSNIASFEDEVKNQMVTEEERRATIDTLQFGAYGAGQAFELEMVGDSAAEVVNSGVMAVEVRELIDNVQNLHRLHENRVEKAIGLAERFPDSYRAWVNLATSYANGGEIEKARKAIEKAVQLAPNANAAKAMQGRLMILEGKIAEALNLYREMLSKSENIAARETVAMLEMVLGNVDKAIDELTTAVERDKKNRASLYYNLGIAHLVKRKSGRAISYFRKALDRDPSYKIAYGGMGVGYSLMGQYSKAERMFRIAVDVESQDPALKLNLARILAMAKKWDSMIMVLVDLVKDFPRHWQAREALGRAYMAVNKFKEAEVQLRRVVTAIRSGEYSGNLGRGLNNLGVQLFFMKEYEEAEELLTSSVEISNRENEKALANLARVYLVTDREQKVGELLEEMRTRFGKENIDVLYLEIQYYYRSEQYDKAIEAATRILDKNEGNVAAAFSLAIILADVYEDYNRAEIVLRRLPREDKESASFLNNLAYILALAGKLKEAEALVSKVKTYGTAFEAVLMATRGLIRIRGGDIAKGAAFYNAAARLVRDEELKKMIRQKKELELGRWYLNNGEDRLAQTHLNRVIEIKVKDKIYERKAKELIRI